MEKSLLGSQFRQVVFLCLARLYAVFAPREVGGIQQKIIDNDGEWHKLLEKETYRFLTFEHAVFLVEYLLEECRYP